MHAVEFLKNPTAAKFGPIVVAYGADVWLRHEALREACHALLGDDPDSAPTRLPGKGTDLRTVTDALRQTSMWAPLQVVVVEDADDFVSEYRGPLEKYLDRPAKKGVLVLDVKSWTATTRLAKKTVELGLSLECSPLSAAALPRWLADQAKRKFGKQLEPAAAQLLIELAGTELGLLSQELGKLALYMGKQPAIDADAVTRLVGGWKAETTWVMLDAVLAGKTGLALQMLDKLLVAGEAAMMLLGAINWMFRPLAQATEIVRQGGQLGDAIIAAGARPQRVRDFEAYLKRIGFARAERLSRHLFQADMDLKGATDLPERIILERLVVQLAGK